MKVGDYVARIKDLKKPSEKEPVGLVVSKRSDAPDHIAFWYILVDGGGLEIFSEKYLEVINEI